MSARKLRLMGNSITPLGYTGPRCIVCGAARGADERHSHEIPSWKPRYDDFEGALEGYEVYRCHYEHTTVPCPCGWTPKEQTMRSDAANASPQFWESAPTTEPNRVFFTSEADGRVVAGGSGSGVWLSREEAISLAAWLLRQTDAERPRKRHTGYCEGTGKRGNFRCWTCSGRGWLSWD